MKMKNLVFGAAAISVLAFQGCSSAALNKKIDTELAKQSAIKTRADLRNEAGKLIQAAPGLTSEQRTQLAALRDSTRTQLAAMWEQSLKLRSVLIKDLISPNYDEDEVDLIEGRMKDLENKRLAVTFHAIDQANRILGHETELDREHIMDAFFEARGSRE